MKQKDKLIDPEASSFFASCRPSVSSEAPQARGCARGRRPHRSQGAGRRSRLGVQPQE